MPVNIHNEFQLLSSQHAILAALKNLQPKRFKEIRREARVGGKTLSKHLGILVAQALLEKDDGRYRITSMGVRYLGYLADRLEKFGRYKMRLASLNIKRLLRHDAVEVIGIGPSGACLGILHVSLPRWLGLEERDKIDVALTKIIHIIAGCVPEDTKRCDLSIVLDRASK